MVGTGRRTALKFYELRDNLPRRVPSTLGIRTTSQSRDRHGLHWIVSQVEELVWVCTPKQYFNSSVAKLEELYFHVIVRSHCVGTSCADSTDNARSRDRTIAPSCDPDYMAQMGNKDFHLEPSALALIEVCNTDALTARMSQGAVPPQQPHEAPQALNPWPTS